MAYRTPFFSADHMLAGATVTASSEASGFPKERTNDRAIDRLFRFNLSVTNQNVTFDVGAGNTIAPTRLIVPAGHNLSGATVQVRSSTDNFGAVNTLVGSGPVGADTINLIWSPPTARRYWRFQVATSGQWEFAEIWLTADITPTGPLHPEWRDPTEPNFTQSQVNSGNTYRVLKGPAKKTFDYRWNFTDSSAFDTLATNTSNGLDSFWFHDPELGALPTYVQIPDGDLISRRQISPAPSGTGFKYEVSIPMIEALA